MGTVFQRQCAAMIFHNALTNGQTDSCTAGVLGVKGLQCQLKGLAREPRTVVSNLHFDIFPGNGDSNFDGSQLRDYGVGVCGLVPMAGNGLLGVGDQVFKNTSQAVWLGGNFIKAFGLVDFELDSFCI